VGEAQAAKHIALASRPCRGRDAPPSCIVGEQRWWGATRERTATHADPSPGRPAWLQTHTIPGDAHAVAGTLPGRGEAHKDTTMPPALSPTPIIDLAVAFWGAKTLLSAVELDLFTTLAAGPLDREALTTRLRLHPRAARDFLDALVALSMLTRTGATYANTPETDAFLVRGKPAYVGDYLDSLGNCIFCV
jgi:Dimerisation domain